MYIVAGSLIPTTRSVLCDDQSPLKRGVAVRQSTCAKPIHINAKDIKHNIYGIHIHTTLFNCTLEPHRVNGAVLFREIPKPNCSPIGVVCHTWLSMHRYHLHKIHQVECTSMIFLIYWPLRPFVSFAFHKCLCHY